MSQRFRIVALRIALSLALVLVVVGSINPGGATTSALQRVFGLGGHGDGVRLGSAGGTGSAPRSSSAPAAGMPTVSGAAAGNGNAGALPFAYEAGFVSRSTNPLRIADMLKGSPAAGISWKFQWADLEPTSGSYDWSPVDHAVAAARSLHLPVILRVIAGMYSPAWVKTRVPTVSIPNRFFPNPGPYPNPTVIPVVWNAAYLTAWEAFVQAFGVRYNGTPDVYLVEMSGDGVIGDMYLPPDMVAWRSAGYSDAVLLAAWRSVVGAYARSFTRTPVALDVAEPLTCKAVGPGFTNPTCPPAYSSNVMAPLATWAVSAFAGHLYVQNNGLKPNYLAFPNCPLRDVVRGAGQKTVVGYQMGVEGTSSANLHEAFTVALQDEASYVEVYQNDVRLDAYTSDFYYLRHGPS